MFKPIKADRPPKNSKLVNYGLGIVVTFLVLSVLHGAYLDRRENKGMGYISEIESFLCSYSTEHYESGIPWIPSGQMLMDLTPSVQRPKFLQYQDNQWYSIWPPLAWRFCPAQGEDAPPAIIREEMKNWRSCVYKGIVGE